MTNKKEIRLTEQALRNLVKNTVHRMISEGMYDYEDEDNYEEGIILTGKDDFENSGFEYDLKKRYPKRKFVCDCDNDGTVTVTDLDNEKEYIGYGDVVYDTVALGRPDSHNPYQEAEGSEGHYDFTGALRDIMAQIDADSNENSLTFAK